MLETPETAAKAKEVEKLVETMGDGVKAESRYRDVTPTPAGPGIEIRKLGERDTFYLYRLTDSAGVGEVCVTFDAMRSRGATTLAGLVLDGRRLLISENGQRRVWVEQSGGPLMGD